MLFVLLFFSKFQLTFLHLIGCGLWFISDSTLFFFLLLFQTERKKSYKYRLSTEIVSQAKRKIYVIKCLWARRKKTHTHKAFTYCHFREEEENEKEWDIEINYNLNQSVALFMIIWIQKILIISVVGFFSFIGISLTLVLFLEKKNCCSRDDFKLRLHGFSHTKSVAIHSLREWACFA